MRENLNFLVMTDGLMAKAKEKIMSWNEFSFEKKMRVLIMNLDVVL